MASNYPTRSKKYFNQDHIVLFILISIVSALISCSKKSSEPQPQPANTSPTISSLSVNQGVYNTPVTITGTNFSTTASQDHVYFNGVEATISSVTSTQLKVVVPLGAGTGNVTVKVNSSTATGPVFAYQLSQVITVFAGDGHGGYSDGTGINVGLQQPEFMVIDPSGNLYVADWVNYVIRKITPDAVVTTLAGTPHRSGNADGTGKDAQFILPGYLTIDATGNLYLVDGPNTIRKITPTGVVTTVAKGNDVTIGNSKFKFWDGIVIDKNGNLFVADGESSQIDKITPDGTISVFAGNGQSDEVDGTAATASFSSLNAMAIDALGNIFVTDHYGRKIRKITPLGQVSTFVGSDTQGQNDGTGADAQFGGCTGLTFRKDGNLYAVDGGLIRKITPQGVVTTYAGSRGLDINPKYILYTLYAICFDAQGNGYVCEESNNVILKISNQ